MHSGLPVRVATPCCSPCCWELGESNQHLRPHHSIAVLIPAQSVHSWQARPRTWVACVGGLWRLWEKVNFSLAKLMFLHHLWAEGGQLGVRGSFYLWLVFLSSFLLSACGTSTQVWGWNGWVHCFFCSAFFLLIRLFLPGGWYFLWGFFLSFFSCHLQDRYSIYLPNQLVFSLLLIFKLSPFSPFPPHFRAFVHLSVLEIKWIILKFNIRYDVMHIHVVFFSCVSHGAQAYCSFWGDFQWEF